MRKPLFTGVCTAIVTPFRGNQIDFDMLGRIIDRQIGAGVRAIVAAGTTGESSTLSDKEKIAMFAACKTYTGDNCLFIAGTGSNATAHSIDLSIAAQEAGAEALLIVTPYYNKATSLGLIKHYASICEHVSIPVIVYNVPSRTGVDIPVSVYRELCQIENIAGVKEASTDITKIARIRNACPDRFSVWSGNDDQIVPAMALGADGVISVVSNIMPSTTHRLCTAALSGDYKTASALQRKLLPLIDALFCEVNPIPVKTAMKEIGLDCGGCRLPLCEMSPENLRKLRSALK